MKNIKKNRKKTSSALEKSGDDVLYYSFDNRLFI